MRSSSIQADTTGDPKITSGDVKVEAYAELAEVILALPPKLGRTRLVAVDGPSGAGRTVFAERLAKAVTDIDGEETPVVHTDDLLDGWSDQLTFWPRLGTAVLTPLSRGEPGRYRRYDWLAAAFGDSWVMVSPAAVVLLDGVSSARAEIRPKLTMSVFVTAPAALRLRRALGRDGVAIRPYLEEWRTGEDRHFAADRTADNVDLVVDGGSDVPHDEETHYIRR
jgi:uridine kinase